jgi:pimeloyl-ACP methyl ester carboxylesterase
MTEVTLSAGKIHYEEYGPAEGRPIVFVHGYAMNSSLWRPLADRLSAGGLRCLVPTWPLGAHIEPMRKAPTMEGVAALINEFLAALELTDVVLVGNDTGGAIAQIVATTYPQRLGALVLTSCDAFEHFPPGGTFKVLIAAAKSAPTFRAVLAPLSTRSARRRGFGPLSHTDIDHLVVEWMQPALTNPGVREDLRRFTRSMNQQTTIDAGARLPDFTKPALIAWSADDQFFPIEDGRRLAVALPHGRFELIEHARTFSMIDQPDVLADLIADFAGADGAQRLARRLDRRVGSAPPTSSSAVRSASGT